MPSSRVSAVGRTAPVHTLVYTHGHVDHVGGAHAIVADAADRGDPRPDIVAHEAVPARFRRYDLTNGYNAVINQRQFARSGLVQGVDADRPPMFPRNWVQPSITYADRLQLKVGDLDIELRHGLGETDDHTWAWIPEHKAVCVGDFVIWAFPNAGNPQKVQRYPLEWAQVLREMQALEPELLLPAHGLPVGGRERVHRLLDDSATALESLVDQTLSLMNEGAHARHDRAHRRGARWAARSAVSASDVRRPRVRRTQHLAALRRLVRRQPRQPQARAQRDAVAIEVAKLGRRCVHARGPRPRPGRTRGVGDLRVAAHLVEMAFQRRARRRTR